MSRLYTPRCLIHVKPWCCRSAADTLRYWLLLRKTPGGSRHPTTVYHGGVTTIGSRAVVVLRHTWHGLIIVVACSCLNVRHSLIVRHCLSRWLLLLLTKAKHCHLLLYLVNLKLEQTHFKTSLNTDTPTIVKY